MNIRRETEQNTLPVAVVIAALFAYVFHLLRYVHNDIWGQIYSVYYPFLIPVLIAFTIYFRRGKWKKEEKLFLLFAVWVYISRLLNGDFFLANDADMVLNTGLGYVFFVVCIALKKENRERLLDMVSVLTSGYFTLLSLLGLYAWLLRRELYNPLTGDTLCPLSELFMYTADGRVIYRLAFFWKSSNEVAMWFFLSLMLLIYLFVRKRKLYWRIPILLAMIPNYLALTVTYSRSGRLAFAVCFALLAMLALLNRLPWRRFFARLLAGLVCIAVVAPLTFDSFNETAIGLQHGIDFLNSFTQKEEMQEKNLGAPSAVMAGGMRYEFSSLKTADSLNKPSKKEKTLAASTIACSEETIGNMSLSKAEGYSDMKDGRGLSDSGRFEIFRSIIPTIHQEPLRLIRGCLCQDVMKIANTVLPNPKPHFHNTFPQLFCLTGLPGLLLIMAFCALLALRSISLFFSSVPMDIKCLALILVGVFIYNMLEVSLFVAADTRAFVTYIVAGGVLAYSFEGEQDWCQAS